MRDHPLNLLETQDQDFLLLILLNLIRLFKKMQRIVDTFKTNPQSKMDKKILMKSHPSYHNKVIAIIQLFIPIEATRKTQSAEIKTTTVKCRVSWVICLLTERITSFKSEILM